MVLLFSYGSLRDKAVQLANFGRELAGRPDTLPGYTRRILPFGGHANAEPDSEPGSMVTGMAFEVTEVELAAADKYEAADQYARIEVALGSGAEAWVYVYARDAPQP